MIKNPDIVSCLAAERESENHKFSTFLGAYSRLTGPRLNHLARQLAEEAARQMDCLECGACCRDIVVPLEDNEIAAMATAKGMCTADFHKQFVREVEGYPQAIDAQPCPLQDGTRCTVYECRPEPCRGYPYIGIDVRSHMPAILERAGTCPIVFEMLEQLKHRLRFRRITG